MTIIALVRHGENDFVKEHRLAGWLPDIHLNDKGRQQAEDAAKRLAPLPVTALYSSPVTRCVETAEYVAQTLNLNVVLVDDLGEVRYGKWEGKKIKKPCPKTTLASRSIFPQPDAIPGG